jgi:hypothetical protein
MTLAAADIERWARQIILPEVGGRGQERLLGATAAVVGDGDAARFAADLLARAGVRSGEATASDVVVDFSADRAGVLARGRRARDARRPFVVVLGTDVTTLAGRPCVDCTPLAASGTAPGAPRALALGALAAGEALRVLLAPPVSGRIQILDAHGGLAARELAGPGCNACRGATS